MKVSKLAVIRVRGGVDVREKVKDTLRMLRLTRPNYCTLTEDDPSRRGMLQKVKERVTWGPIKAEVLEDMIRERGELDGGNPVTDEAIQESSSYDGIKEFVEAVCEGDADLDEVDGMKKVFRLHSPRKGYNNIRRSFSHGGTMGDRGEKINDLILRMI